MRDKQLETASVDFDKALEALYNASGAFVKIVQEGVDLGVVKQEHFDEHQEIQDMRERLAYRIIMTEGNKVLLYLKSVPLDEIDQVVWDQAMDKIAWLTKTAYKDSAHILAQAELADGMNKGNIQPVAPISEPDEPSADPFASAKRRMRGEMN